MLLFAAEITQFLTGSGSVNSDKPEAILVDTRSYCQNKNIIDMAPSPIKLDTLQTFLRGYDNAEAQFLFYGFKYGFSLQYHGPRQTRVAKKLKSAYEHPEVISEKKF